MGSAVFLSGNLKQEVKWVCRTLSLEKLSGQQLQIAFCSGEDLLL